MISVRRPSKETTIFPGMDHSWDCVLSTLLRLAGPNWINEWLKLYCSTYYSSRKQRWASSCLASTSTTARCLLIIIPIQSIHNQWECPQSTSSTSPFPIATKWLGYETPPPIDHFSVHQHFIPSRSYRVEWLWLSNCHCNNSHDNTSTKSMSLSLFMSADALHLSAINIQPLYSSFRIIIFLHRFR